MNSGYVGFSRSVRSAEAVASYEVPISLINKSLIKDYLNQEEEIKESEKQSLSNMPVGLWKYVAKMVGPSSWHHTGSMFKETDHYSLSEIAEELTENKEIVSQYKAYCASKKATKKDTDIIFAVIKVEEWGGSRKHPVLEGYDEVAGILKGDWVYHRFGKYKASARKVVSLKKYNSYAELVKANKEYKGTKKEFNALIKER